MTALAGAEPARAGAATSGDDTLLDLGQQLVQAWGEEIAIRARDLDDDA